MSAETDLRTLLAAAAGVTALVPAARIALNAAAEGSSYPLIVYAAQRTREHGLDNTLHAQGITYEVQCWAETPASAEAVADAVEAAISATTAYLTTARASGFDQDLLLDVVSLTVERWLDT